MNLEVLIMAHVCIVDKLRSPANFYQNRQCPWLPFSRSKIWTVGSSYVIILQKVTNRAKITKLPTNRNLHTGFWWAYLHLTLAHSKSHGQGHADCHCEYLANGKKNMANIGLTLAHSKGPGQGYHVITIAMNPHGLSISIFSVDIIDPL